MADFETCSDCGITFMFLSHQWLTDAADYCPSCLKKRETRLKAERVEPLEYTKDNLQKTIPITNP